MKTLQAYAQDTWIAPHGTMTPIRSAVTGEPVAQLGETVRDFKAILAHARTVGGPSAPQAHVPRPREDAESTRRRDHGPQRRTLRPLL